MKLRIEYLTDKVNEKIIECEQYCCIEGDSYEFLGPNRKLLLYVKNLLVLERLDETQSS